MSPKKKSNDNPELSDGQRRTLEALQSHNWPPFPVIFFKNHNRTHALAKLADLINGHYALYEPSGSAYPPEPGPLIAEFRSARELVEAGWSFD